MPSKAHVPTLLVIGALALGGCIGALALGGCDDKPSKPTSPTPDTAAAISPSAAEQPDSSAAASGEQAEADASGEAQPSDSAAVDAGDKAATAKKDSGDKAAPAGSAASDDKDKKDEPPGKVVGDKKAEASYAAWLQSAGKYTVGKTSSVQAVLVAKGGFKCNENYPYKFKLNAPPAGVSYPSNIARNISKGKQRSVLSIPFTATKAGSKTIGGTFYFSVCNAESCHIKKQPMSVTIKVNEPDSK